MTRLLTLPALDLLIETHGAGRVALAALAAMLRPRPARPLAVQMAPLCDHLRRDIGLPPQAAAPPLPGWVTQLR